MEESILNAIREILHEDVDPRSITHVGGGSINACFRASTATRELFVKVNDAGRFPLMFEREMEGLDLLRRNSSFVTPEVFGVSYQKSHALLVMEFLPSEASSEASDLNFGDALSSLHKQSSAQVGLDRDNYIGSLDQSNEPADAWIDFFVSRRLDPMLQKAIDARLMDRQDGAFFRRLYTSLGDHFPVEPPALLHGDLWSGNSMTVTEGRPALFDPAIYYGHRYVDLGMMQLFGGFHPLVFESYHQQFPLEPDWRCGAEVANLYPLLVHVNLFGSSYLGQVRSILKRYT